MRSLRQVAKATSDRLDRWVEQKVDASNFAYEAAFRAEWAVEERMQQEIARLQAKLDAVAQLVEDGLRTSDDGDAEGYLQSIAWALEET